MTPLDYGRNQLIEYTQDTAANWLTALRQMRPRPRHRRLLKRELAGFALFAMSRIIADGAEHEIRYGIRYAFAEAWLRLHAAESTRLREAAEAYASAQNASAGNGHDELGTVFAQRAGQESEPPFVPVIRGFLSHLVAEAGPAIATTIHDQKWQVLHRVGPRPDEEQQRADEERGD